MILPHELSPRRSTILAFDLSVEQQSWIEAEGDGIATWTTQHARDKVLRQSASQRHSKVGSRRKQIASPDQGVIHQKSNHLVPRQVPGEGLQTKVK